MKHLVIFNLLILLGIIHSCKPNNPNNIATSYIGNINGKKAFCVDFKGLKKVLRMLKLKGHLIRKVKYQQHLLTVKKECFLAQVL